MDSWDLHIPTRVGPTCDPFQFLPKGIPLNKFTYISYYSNKPQDTKQKLKLANLPRCQATYVLIAPNEEKMSNAKRKFHSAKGILHFY